MCFFSRLLSFSFFCFKALAMALCLKDRYLGHFLSNAATGVAFPVAARLAQVAIQWDGCPKSFNPKEISLWNSRNPTYA